MKVSLRGRSWRRNFLDYKKFRDLQRANWLPPPPLKKNLNMPDTKNLINAKKDLHKIMRKNIK